LQQRGFLVSNLLSLQQLIEMHLVALVRLDGEAAFSCDV